MENVSNNPLELKQVLIERDRLVAERDLLLSERDKLQQWVAFEPNLIPPLHLMREEGVSTLEEWFRWAEEWSMLLRVYGGINKNSSVLEIGCGLGRIAFPLRYILSIDGRYDGFDICPNKIEFLEQTFKKAYPNFRFTLANIYNTFYNSKGGISAAKYRFPYPDNFFDIVYAASVFTHMLPESSENYFKESARVLKKGGRCLFSFFMLNNYQAGHPRPLGFSKPIFNFDHHYEDYGDDFALAVPDNPEYMTSYSLDLILKFANNFGLELNGSPITGFWSGSTSSWIGTQDLIVLNKT
jgi:SAM-dependent methyltransferase